METKKIVEKLNNFCESFFKKNVVGIDLPLFKEAAERLEELEAELGKRTINDRPYEWISVEDRLPGTRDNVLAYDINDIGTIYIAFYFDGLWRQDDIPHVGVDTITHWMPLPEPPKPKEPTFKDVFLKAFPGAVVLPKSGAPLVCAKQVFPQLGDDESPCDMCCAECWNQPYFETEEEGEADA